MKKKKDVYEPLKGIMGNGADYHIYTMRMIDRIIAAILGIAIGGLVIYTFFRVLIFSLVVGVMIGILLQEPYREYCKKKRLRNLLLQFKDLLEALSASYSAGDNTVSAFNSAVEDMTSIYGEESDIVNELKIIQVGLQHNINIEVLLLDFGKRCSLDDVTSFADVFESCIRQGSDLKRIVGESKEVISDKIEVEMEIQTMLAGNKNELNIMICMPVLIILMLSSMGTASIASNSFLNIVVKVTCLGIFAVAYKMGLKIVNIKA